MKKILFSLIIFTFVIGASLGGQSPQYAVWDYPYSELSLITEFQFKLDTGAYQSVGLPSPETFPDTTANHKSFRHLLPAVSAGQTHTLYIRACDATECSWDATHAFKLVGPPVNLRIHKG